MTVWGSWSCVRQLGSHTSAGLCQSCTFLLWWHHGDNHMPVHGGAGAVPRVMLALKPFIALADIAVQFSPVSLHPPCFGIFPDVERTKVFLQGPRILTSVVLFWFPFRPGLFTQSLQCLLQLHLVCINYWLSLL